MFGKSKGSAGSSMVELIMVMVLLVLFSVTIFTLISSVNNTQSKILESKASQSDARSAISFINVKLRQNCSKGSISVETCEASGENGILIEFRREDEYDSWIYYKNGFIYEFLGSAGEAATEELSIPVMPAEGLSVEYDDKSNCVTATVFYEYGEQIKSITAIVNLRVTQEPEARK